MESLSSLGVPASRWCQHIKLEFNRSLPAEEDSVLQCKLKIWVYYITQGERLEMLSDCPSYREIKCAASSQRSGEPSQREAGLLPGKI